MVQAVSVVADQFDAWCLISISKTFGENMMPTTMFFRESRRLSIGPYLCDLVRPMLGTTADGFHEDFWNMGHGYLSRSTRNVFRRCRVDDF